MFLSLRKCWWRPFRKNETLAVLSVDPTPSATAASFNNPNEPIPVAHPDRDYDRMVRNQGQMMNLGFSTRAALSVRR